MSPVTRSSTADARMKAHEEQFEKNQLENQMENQFDKDRFHEIVHEIRTGLLNIEFVVGREYKKYIVYALFDYLCIVKEDLKQWKYKFNTEFNTVLKKKIDEFINEAKQDLESDHIFLTACLYYKHELSDLL